MPPEKWNIVATSHDQSLRIFKLRTDRARSPRTGEEHNFFVLESPPWVNVIPITAQGEVVLIHQYRHGIRDITLEIPGGLIEPGDSPEAAARRELREETGYAAAEFIPLGYVHPNPAIQDNLCYTFLAKDARRQGGQQLDDKEDIEVLLKPVDAIPALISSGAITHSLVIAAFYRYFLEYLPGK